MVWNDEAAGQESAQAEDQTQAGDTQDNQPNEQAQMRAELDRLKSQNEFLNKARQEDQKRIEDSERGWRKLASQQGNEIGRYRALFESAAKQTEEKRPNKKRISDTVDPVLNSGQFLENWQAMVENLQNLEERLAQMPDYSDKLKTVEEELHSLKTENFLSREEAELVSKYKLSTEMLEQVKDFAKRSQLPSLKSAMVHIPEVEAHILSLGKNTETNTNGNGFSSTSRKQAGQELQKVNQPTVPRGGRQKEPDPTDVVKRLQEIQEAVGPNGDWERWSDEKKAEAQRFVDKHVGNGQTKNTSIF